jgi:hypothetical protein
MGRLVGMDEAGYGPNLGPLVVAATCWDTPGEPAEFDGWIEFETVLGQPPVDGSRIAVGDSKKVYQPGGSLKRLETTVLAFLQLCGLQPRTLGELCQVLGGQPHCVLENVPWFAADDVSLPTAASNDVVERFATRWRCVCEQLEIAPPSAGVTVLTAAAYNRAVAETDNKAIVLSQSSLGLLATLVNPDDRRPTFVQVDKHGGRNRYDELLCEAFDDRLVMRQQEGAACSRYQLGTMEVVFEPRSERHFPVALASMLAKYIRELAMDAFNAFWLEACPGIRPTRGYPVDARRFRDDVGRRLDELGIAEEVFWRQR